MKTHLNAKRLYDVFGKCIPLIRGEFYAAMLNLDKGIYPENMGMPLGDYSGDRRATLVMRALDILLEGHGWECIRHPETKTSLLIDYLNFGDPYVPTILYCERWKRPFRFAPGGWGDYIK